MGDRHLLSILTPEENKKTIDPIRAPTKTLGANDFLLFHGPMLF